MSEGDHGLHHAVALGVTRDETRNTLDEDRTICAPVSHTSSASRRRDFLIKLSAVVAEKRVLEHHLRRIATRAASAPSDVIPRGLRALADRRHPPIAGGKVVREFGSSRVARKSHAGKSFQIHVGK